MSSAQRVPLPWSERPRPTDARLGDVDPDETATLTLYLRRAAPLPERGRLSREELAARHGASDEDVATVEAFASTHGLRVDSVDRGRRAVRVTGRLADLATAFGASLALHQGSDGRTYRARVGALSAPADLASVVTGVFGLDERPQAQPRWRPVTPGAAATAITYSPPEVAAAYDFPSGTDGTGQCVGLIELGGGYQSDDLTTYFEGLGITPPTVVTVGVDGATNSPSTPDGPDTEVMLDIEVVGSIAPGAQVAVYFAPNTDQGFLDAITTAVHDTTNTPSVVSISWGGPESTWTAQAMTTMEDAFATAATLGVTVTVAAGDGGSSDGVSDGQPHVDFPASAPHALGCGGTSLHLTDDVITTEVVWNELSGGGGATGGGVSQQFALPTWQASAGVPPPPSGAPDGAGGRGVPDVAGDADPDTGYEILVDGQSMAVGGTSAVAPLWAALVARLNEALGQEVGYLNPVLYQIGLPGGTDPSAFHEITAGSNGAYSAGPGWNPCTGLGSPNGASLLLALQGTTATSP